MISYTDVEKLLAVHSEDPPVLSLYLEVPLDRPARHGLPARASDLLNSAAGCPCGPAGPDAGRVLAHARQVVRRLLEDRARDWLGHCVAIFICGPAGGFLVHPRRGRSPRRAPSRSTRGPGGDVLALREEPSRPGHEALLVPVIRAGQRLSGPEPLTEAQQRCRADLAWLPPAARALRGPVPVPVQISGQLQDRLRQELTR